MMFEVHQNLRRFRDVWAQLCDVDEMGPLPIKGRSINEPASLGECIIPL